MRRILIAVVCGLGGLIAGALITFFGGLVFGEIAHISQAEGAYAMGLAFFWAPIGAILGAGMGLWLALRH